MHIPVPRHLGRPKERNGKAQQRNGKGLSHTLRLLAQPSATTLGQAQQRFRQLPTACALVALPLHKLTQHELAPSLKMNCPFFSTSTTLSLNNFKDNVVDFVFKAFVSIITSLGYVGNKPCRQSVVDKTLSSHRHASKAFSKRNASYWIVRVLAVADFGCRWLSQLWRVTEPRPDIENLCGHDTGGFHVLTGEV